MRILEVLFTKPEQQARLAHSAVAYDDQLQKVVERLLSSSHCFKFIKLYNEKIILTKGFWGFGGIKMSKLFSTRSVHSIDLMFMTQFLAKHWISFLLQHTRLFCSKAQSKKSSPKLIACQTHKLKFKSHAI